MGYLDAVEVPDAVNSRPNAAAWRPYRKSSTVILTFVLSWRGLGINFDLSSLPHGNSVARSYISHRQSRGGGQ